MMSEASLPFEPRWFPILRLLSRKGRLAVGELARIIGITHAAVSQVRSELVRSRHCPYQKGSNGPPPAVSGTHAERPELVQGV